MIIIFIADFYAKHMWNGFKEVFRVDQVDVRNRIISDNHFGTEVLAAHFFKRGLNTKEIRYTEHTLYSSVNCIKM